jgi:ribosomal protein L14E/L6E/L27E
MFSDSKNGVSVAYIQVGVKICQISYYKKYLFAAPKSSSKDKESKDVEGEKSEVKSVKSEAESEAKPVKQETEKKR